MNVSLPTSMESTFGGVGTIYRCRWPDQQIFLQLQHHMPDRESLQIGAGQRANGTEFSRLFRHHGIR